jgi:pimeloyl-ACP methyl ester carboxylesterase
VVTVGHSAGGHLALWAAGRPKLPPEAPGAAPAPGVETSGVQVYGVQASGVRVKGVPVSGVRVSGAIGLAPVADLAEAAAMGLGGGAVIRLLGGSPERRPERYAVADPARLLPLGVPQVLVHGDRDGAVPIVVSRHYVERAVAAGDPATLVELPGVGHMELIDPASAAWSSVLLHLRRLVA